MILKCFLLSDTLSTLSPSKFLHKAHLQQQNTQLAKNWCDKVKMSTKTLQEEGAGGRGDGDMISDEGRGF